MMVGALAAASDHEKAPPQGGEVESLKELGCLLPKSHHISLDCLLLILFYKIFLLKPLLFLADCNMLNSILDWQRNVV